MWCVQLEQRNKELLKQVKIATSDIKKVGEYVCCRTDVWTASFKTLLLPFTTLDIVWSELQSKVGMARILWSLICFAISLVFQGLMACIQCSELSHATCIEMVQQAGFFMPFVQFNVLASLSNVLYNACITQTRLQVYVELQNSLKLIIKKLREFTDMFRLGEEKLELVPCRFYTVGNVVDEWANITNCNWP